MPDRPQPSSLASSKVLVVGRPSVEVHAATVRHVAEPADLGAEACSGEWDVVLYDPRDGAVARAVASCGLPSIGLLPRPEPAEERALLLDPLTGVATRPDIEDGIRLAFERHAGGGPCLAVLAIDMDRFQTVNDGLGRAAGDLVLQVLARRLRHSLRDGDLVGRLGGDEFAVVLSGTPPEELTAVARRIVERLARPIALDHETLTITASIGIAPYPEAGRDPGDLLRAAEEAMYTAKREGRGAIALARAPVGADARRRLRLESDLVNALERNEFELFYQPIVCLFSRTLHATEALIRWRRADRLVSPAEFIPILERSREIHHTGRWVARTALAQVRAWRDAGRHVGQVAINVSPRQLDDELLVPTIRDALDHYALEPGALEVELTESVLITNRASALKVIDDLKRLGVAVAIDDFGTGYSSLSYLHEFPVDTLKIDRSMVKELEAGTRRASVTGAIVELGRRLGMEVIAEGIETEEEAAMMLSEGCPRGQGYLFGRPLEPAVAVEPFFDRVRTEVA